MSDRIINLDDTDSYFDVLGSGNWIFHGTSPITASKIRRDGICKFKNDSGIYFSPFFSAASNYSITYPRRGHIPQKLSEYMFKYSGDIYGEHLPVAMFRVRRDDEVLSNCKKSEHDGGWVWKYKCKTKCTKPSTLELCIIPARRKWKEEGLTGWTKTMRQCEGRWRSIK